MLNRRCRGVLAGVLLLAGCAGGGLSGGDGGGEMHEHWRSAYNPRSQGASAAEVERNFNLFRGQWWNYYARGQWFFELGFPEQAAADYRVAIARRNADQRDARSYGMHFWEYFPHRELGVSLFTLQRFEEAAKELERSLATEDSARAKFYLNKARAAIVKSGNRDSTPPVIAVDPVGSGGLVSTPTVTLRGTASDDTFVAGVRVSGSPVLVELAESRVEFSRTVSLRPGANTVRVEADDIAGRTHAADVQITLDRVPPVLSIDAAAGAAEVACTSADDRGLREITVGGKKTDCGGATQCTARVPRSELRAGRLSVEVRDLAGNVTHAEIDPREMAAPGGKGAFLRGVPVDGRQVAALGAVPYLLAAADEDRVPPRIEVNLPVKDVKLTTMDEDLFLDGTIYDPGGVAALSVNGEPIPLPPQNGSMVVFSHILALKEGDNVVEIKATDRAGNAGSKRFEVRRVSAETVGNEARYSIGFLPPDKKPTDAELGDSAYDALLDSIMREPVRFRVLERDRAALEQILLEQKLTDLAARGTAVRIGKLLAAEGVLFGRVDEGRTGVTLELRLVDTETSEILIATDVFGEEKDLRSLRFLANGLVSKIKVGFPIVEGEVVTVDGSQVKLNVGKEQGLRKGMRLLFYRQDKDGALATRKLLKQGEAFVQAKVTAVGKADATAEIVGSKGGPAVRVSDRVVTK